MDFVNEQAKNIFDLLITKDEQVNFNESIINFINSYDKHTNNSSRENSKIDLINVNDVFNLLNVIKEILHIEFPIWTSDGITQHMKTINFAHILDAINKEDIHRITIDGVQYGCDMHMESLTTHLLTAMLVVYQRISVGEPEMNYTQILAYCVTALLHDIGKYITVGTTYGKKNWTQYPFHGEMGAGILL